MITQLPASHDLSSLRERVSQRRTARQRPFQKGLTKIGQAACIVAAEGGPVLPRRGDDDRIVIRQPRNPAARKSGGHD